MTTRKGAGHDAGQTNAASVSELDKVEDLPPVEIEDVVSGREGRLLSRVHNRITAAAKRNAKACGLLVCEACGRDPIVTYGPGERCIEAHHKIPIEELQPDSVTLVTDTAVLCASCHRIVHSRKPCLTIDEVKSLLS